MWTMFAGVIRDKEVFVNMATDARHALHHGHNPPIEVIVKEDEAGEYFGWMRPSDTEPVMIQPHRGMFEMQFPWGSKAEQEAGNGKVLKLTVERAKIKCPMCGGEFNSTSLMNAHVSSQHMLH